MVSRAALYAVPIGTTIFCMPSAVFAAGKRSSPSCVYDEPKKEKCECQAEPECKETELERLVMKCRAELGPAKEKCSTYTDNMAILAKQSYDSVMDNVCYLRTRAPTEVRIGTVVAGGLFGMMLGIRKGFTRKLLFGGLGAAGASYMVAPNETVYFSRNGFSIAKKYAFIGYNFVVGGNLGQQNDCPKKCRSDAPAAKLKSEKAERNIRPS